MDAHIWLWFSDRNLQFVQKWVRIMQNPFSKCCLESLTLLKSIKISKLVGYSKPHSEFKNSPNLILRKIWVTEKSWNFHTVRNQGSTKNYVKVGVKPYNQNNRKSQVPLKPGILHVVPQWERVLLLCCSLNLSKVLGTPYCVFWNQPYLRPTYWQLPFFKILVPLYVHLRFHSEPQVYLG